MALRLDSILTDRRWAVIAVAGGGLMLTAVLSYQAWQSSWALWRQARISEAERLSRALEYRVIRAREPLSALAVLYGGSSSVTQDEMNAAFRQLSGVSDVTRGMAMGFWSTAPAADTRPMQVAGAPALVAEMAVPGPQRPIARSLALAGQQPGTIALGPLFASLNRSYLALSLTAQNNNAPGVLISLIDFSRILHDITAGLDDSGTHLTLYKTGSSSLDHVRLPEPAKNPLMVHQTRLDIADEPWILEWRFRLENGNGPDWRLPLATLVSGLSITFLCTFLAAVLWQRWARVEQEVKRKSQELVDAHSRLLEQEKMAALGRLVMGFSHELNTPIGNAVLASSVSTNEAEAVRQALAQARLKRSTLEQALARIDESTQLVMDNLKRAEELVQGFKQVAVDQATEQRRHFDLTGVIQQTLGTLQPQFRQGAHQLSMQLEPELSMDSFPGAISQVLTNLVSNALQHGLSPDTAGEVRVVMRSLPNDYVEIRVQDSGQGMPSSVSHRVFEPFFTTNPGAGGTGMGLHLSYNLVNRVLGGSIHVISQIGAGSQFTLTMPRVAPTSESALWEASNEPT